MVAINEALLLSVRPSFAKMILSGEKTIELRRTKPRLIGGDHVLLYESSPTMALVGLFEVDHVITGTPSSLWRRVRDKAGISKAIFDSYFCGATDGYGIVVRKVKSLSCSVPLETLRRIMPGFHPPQSYRYLDRSELDVLLEQ